MEKSRSFIFMRILNGIVLVIMTLAACCVDSEKWYIFFGIVAASVIFFVVEDQVIEVKTRRNELCLMKRKKAY